MNGHQKKGSQEKIELSAGGPGASRINKQEKPKSSYKTIKRLLGYLKERLGAIILASLANVTVTVLTILSMHLMGVAVDNYITTYRPDMLAKLCVALIFLFAFTSCASYMETRIMAKLAQSVSFTLRKNLYEKISALPLVFFDKNPVGDVMSRFTNDVDNVNDTLSQSISSLLESSITLIGTLIAMFLLSPKLTMWSLLILPLTMICTKIVVHYSRKYFKKLQASLGEINAYAEEIISAQKMLLLYRQKDQFLKSFGKMNDELAESYKLAQTFSALGPLMSFINNISYLIITFVGSIYILNGSTITVGILFTFLLYMRRFARPLNNIASLFNTIQSAIAGAERIFNVLDKPIESNDNLSLYNFKGGHIVYENVSFAYEENGPWVLRDVSFEIPAGKTLALVGATGSGKTTVVSLLNRFYDPTRGRIIIDGQNIETLDRRSLRRQIGLVLQDTFLFNDTIKNNIRYGSTAADTIDDALVEKAANAANADTFINQLPDGYHTVLSDNGNNFSHGQRQLLAISRAILANAPILILDEATSSIDTQTEQYVQAALDRLTSNRTTIVIAHRLSTIRNADKIVVLDNGKIIEQGDHKTLMALNGHYATMVNNQLSSGINQ